MSKCPSLFIIFLLLLCGSAVLQAESQREVQSEADAGGECQLAAVQHEPGDPVPVECSGGCDGRSIGTAVLDAECDDLTLQQQRDLANEACDKTSQNEARTNANNKCMNRGGATCLCTGGTFTIPTFSFEQSGSTCVAVCILDYKNGTCNTVAFAPGAGSAG